MGIVIHISSQGGGGVFQLWKFTATNYADLLTKVGMIEGDLAIVYNSQGVWLINRKLKGVYMFQSGVWEYANQELQDQIQALDLAKVMSVDNNTGPNDLIIINGQRVVGSVGNGFLDLESATDSAKFGYDKSVVFIGDNGVTRFVTLQAGTFGVDVTSQLTMTETLINLGIFNTTFTRHGQICCEINEGGSVASSGIAQYPIFIGSQSGTAIQNLINSVILGGINIIAKTNNSAYINQLGYNEGAAGELIVKHTPNANNFIQTHQAASGDISLVGDLGIEGFFLDAKGAFGAGGGWADEAFIGSLPVLLFSQNQTERATYMFFALKRAKFDEVDPVVLFAIYSIDAPAVGNRVVRWELEARYVAFGDTPTGAADETIPETQTLDVLAIDSRQTDLQFTLDKDLISNGDVIFLILRRLGGDVLDNYSSDIGVGQSGISLQTTNHN